jgi:hypothetical protein
MHYRMGKILKIENAIALPERGRVQFASELNRRRREAHRVPQLGSSGRAPAGDMWIRLEGTLYVRT